MQLSAWLCALLVASAAGLARADGEISVRGAYYKERSTRVEQPMIDARFDAGDRGLVQGHFLVDSITSASAATGASGASPFTERRYEGGIDYTHELPAHVKIGAQVRYSTESDYFSTFVAGHGELALFDQTSTLRLLVGHSFDRITNGVALQDAAPGAQHREEHLDTTLVSLGATQVLSPRVVAGLTYDLMVLSGYQANIYRTVPGGSRVVFERVPDLRLRHAIAASLHAYLPTATTAVLAYRLYVDDWGIVAHTPEVRVTQQIVKGLDVRARYRFYVQSKADFYKDIYMQAELDDPSVYVTKDEKLSAFTTHIIGGQLSFLAGLLGVRGPFGDIRFDAIVERVFQSTAFGNAWVAQLGVAVPFLY